MSIFVSNHEIVNAASRETALAAPGDIQGDKRALARPFLIGKLNLRFVIAEKHEKTGDER